MLGIAELERVFVCEVARYNRDNAIDYWTFAVFTKLRLQRFKNFRDAELILGPFTILVGTNASGKSNIRDAFRFLHGIGRGYGIAEIFGEKWGPGGELVWRGIRGGSREAAFLGDKKFELKSEFYHELLPEKQFRYEIDVSPPDESGHVGCEERLSPSGGSILYPRFHANGVPQFGRKPTEAEVEKVLDDLSNVQAVRSIIQNLLRESKSLADQLDHQMDEVLPKKTLEDMRFLELHPEAMRRASLPGQLILGDQGENLSSILRAICDDNAKKAALLGWMRELTPMDAADIEFSSDVTGKILLSLVEENGQRISAESVSDGTLRFLGLLAALMGPNPSQFYFIEELETGVHPTRLALLMQLLEHNAYKEKNPIQIVATTHSPLVLALASERVRESASLVYRLPGEAEGRIRRIMSIPEVGQVLEETDLGKLFATGWLDDAVAFTQEAGAAS